MERECKRKRVKEKTLTHTCPVSGPPYFKYTQINAGAIAFSKRTADTPINECRG